LPPDGTLTACDISEEFTNRARQAWADAGVSDKVSLHLGPATETLAAFRAEGRVFDMAFIDADKPNYPTYYEDCLAMVRPGGSILIDNMLWAGRVANPEDTDPETEMFRQLTTSLRDDPRIDFALVTVGDGIAICRVRG
jgi:caffeoyl-CoA O-methyltransferase